MIVEQIKAAYGHWATRRKVEPVNHIEEEFPLEKEKEEVVIVEIEFDDEAGDQKLLQEDQDQPLRKHKLSIWV